MNQITPKSEQTRSILTESDKNLIREYVSAGKTDDERRSLRMDCVQNFWVSLSTIAAITAWTTIRNNRSHTEITEVLESTPDRTVHVLAVTPLEASDRTNDISKLSSDDRRDILREIDDLLHDDDELPYIDEHIMVIAEDYGVSTWTIELLARQNLPEARIRIERVRSSILDAEMNLANPATPLVADNKSSGTANISQSSETGDIVKDSIRAYVAAAKTDAEKKQRRREMAEKHGLTIYQVGAITAWTKIWADKNTLVTPEPEDILVTTGSNTEQSERVSSNTEQEITLMETNMEGDEEFLSEYAREFDLDDPDQLVEFRKGVAELYPDAAISDINVLMQKLRLEPKTTPEMTESLEEQEVEKWEIRGEGMGALIDYDTPIKNAWRAKLKAFVDENTDPTKRAEMKVLCLPGVSCLEIPLYLELGFRPENIVGVEAGLVNGKTDPSLLARFEENVRRYGIQYRLGKLERVLKTEETVFDVVSLDFLGPISKSTLDVLIQLRLQGSSCIVTNFQWRRENLLQQNLVSEYVMGTEDYRSALSRHLIQGAPKPELQTDGILDVARNSSAVGWVVRGFLSVPGNGIIFDRLDRLFSRDNLSQFWPLCASSVSEVQVPYVFRTVVCNAAEGMFEWLLNPDSPKGLSWQTWTAIKNYHQWFLEVWGCIPGYVKSVLNQLVFARPKIVGHRMYSYKNGTTPMVTDCLKLEWPNEGDFDATKHTIRFLFLLASEVVSSLIDQTNATLLLTDKQHRPKEFFDTFSKDDLFCLYHGDRIVAEINVFKFHADLTTCCRAILKETDDRIPAWDREEIIIQ